MRLDALNLAQQLSKQLAETLVVLDVNEGLAVAHHLFHHPFRLAFFKTPVADPCTVAHVSFFDVRSQLETLELGQHAVAQVAVVLCAPHIEGFHEAEVHHFLVEQEVQSHQIGTAFLQRGAVFLNGLLGGPHSGLQLS